MKYIIFLILAFCYFNPINCFGQVVDKDSSNQNKDTIVIWSKNKKLMWCDFKGVEKDKNINGATSSTGIMMLPYMNKDKKYSYKVLACFYKNTSSTNTNSSNYILNHEQLHFDITELFARKIRQEIKIQELKSSYVDHISIYRKSHKEYRRYQNLYDIETNHSTNFENQKKWDFKIFQELKKFDCVPPILPK